MANEEDLNKKPYDYNKDKLYKKILERTSQKNQLNQMGENFFMDITAKNYQNAKQRETAINAQKSSGQKPVMPKKYIYKGQMATKKKGKLPKSLSLILAAAIAVGGISIITLGIKHIQDSSRDNALSNSQQTLENTAYNNINSTELNTNQSQNNNLLILNADLNDLLKRYKQDPNSVSQEEVANLLNTTYQEGRNIIFPMIADAYNSYSQENDEFPQVIDSEDLVYLNTKDAGWQIAYRSNSNINYNGQAIAYNSNKLTDFITTQENMHNLYEYNSETSTLNLKEGTTIEQAINCLVNGMIDVNDIASSDIHFEKGLLGEKILKINERQKEDASFDKDTSNAQAVNLSHNDNDLGDEGR